MWSGVSTLLARSLRLESRGFRTHLVRLGFIGILYLFFMNVQLAGPLLGAPGMAFFHRIVLLDWLLIGVAAVTYFSLAIAEEKDEGTIGLLLMAGINPVGLLLGKSTARLLQGLLLIMLQVPLVLLAITLGGVTLSQIFAATVALLAHAILMANLGLLASVVMRSGLSAGAMMALAWWFLATKTRWAPALSNLCDAIAPRTGWLAAAGDLVSAACGFIARCDVVLRLNEVCSTGFNGSPWCPQVAFELVGGGVAFLLAWRLFESCALNATVVSERRWFLMRTERSRSSFAPGRVWRLPILWKEFHFLTGGTAGAVVRWLLILVAYPVTAALRPSPYATPVISLGGVVLSSDHLWVHMLCVGTALVLEGSFLVYRLFREEIRQKTLVSLLGLPRLLVEVVVSKILGMLLGLIPWLIGLGLDLQILNLTIPTGERARPLLVGLSLAPPVIVFWQMIMLVSLYNGWRAVMIGMLALMSFVSCCPVWSTISVIAPRDNTELAGVILSGVMVTLWTSVFVQLVIHHRLDQIGSQ